MYMYYEKHITEPYYGYFNTNFALLERLNSFILSVISSLSANQHMFKITILNNDPIL